MNLEAFRQELQQSPEYQEASDKLKFRFALANAVLRARLKKGWTQVQLAEAVGTKQANISRIEAALANPTLDFIHRLCEVLCINLEFSGREGQKAQIHEKVSETTSTSLPIAPMRVDNQPDNLFYPGFSIGSKNKSVNEGTLK